MVLDTWVKDVKKELEEGQRKEIVENDQYGRPVTRYIFEMEVKVKKITKKVCKSPEYEVIYEKTNGGIKDGNS